MLNEPKADGVIAADVMGRTVEAPPDEVVRRLTKINAALVERLENRIDQQASAYSLFQTAIGLEGQVRQRTAELKTALDELERSNAELVKAKEAAEKANSSKTRFLAAAGHDLLQPLYAAQLSISTLAETQTSGECAALCRQIDRALVTIEAYLRSILDISKLDAGVITPEIQCVSLSDIFQSLDSDFRPIVERKNLKLRFRPTDLVVSSDPILLRRVLQNLVSNAARYTRTGGVLIGARLRGDQARIEVTDTGVGIEPQEIERVFEEFHRATSTDAPRTGEGLGLGLSIVRRMTQALDHRIEVRSRVGRGSRFAVVAPIAWGDSPRAADLVLVDLGARERPDGPPHPAGGKRSGRAGGDALAAHAMGRARHRGERPRRCARDADGRAAAGRDCRRLPPRPRREWPASDHARAPDDGRRNSKRRRHRRPGRGNDRTCARGRVRDDAQAREARAAQGSADASAIE